MARYRARGHRLATRMSIKRASEIKSSRGDPMAGEYAARLAWAANSIIDETTTPDTDSRVRMITCPIRRPGFVSTQCQTHSNLSVSIATRVFTQAR